MDSQSDTRERFLMAATRLFAARGYYGASISNIADELGLSKQALLHHFGSKDRIYLAVVSAQVTEVRTLLFAATKDASLPEDQLETFWGNLCGFGLEDPDRLQVIIREIMDCILPQAKSGIQELLENLGVQIQATDRWKGCSAAEAMTVVCQCFGAVHFFLSTENCQLTIFGETAYEAARDVHFTSLPPLVSSLLRG